MKKQLLTILFSVVLLTGCSGYKEGKNYEFKNVDTFEPAGHETASFFEYINPIFDEIAKTCESENIFKNVKTNEDLFTVITASWKGIHLRNYDSNEKTWSFNYIGDTDDIIKGHMKKDGSFFIAPDRVFKYDLMGMMTTSTEGVSYALATFRDCKLDKKGKTFKATLSFEYSYSHGEASHDTFITLGIK